MGRGSFGFRASRFLIFGALAAVLAGAAPAGAAVRGALENPQPGSFASGIGVISGWVCEAQDVEIELDELVSIPAVYGTERDDTLVACGDSGNGFGLLFNWNRLGKGPHSLRLLVDGEELARADFEVTTFGTYFLRGLEASYKLMDFPGADDLARVQWEQSLQNFVITAAAGPETELPALVPAAGSAGGLAEEAPLGMLENPRPDSFVSGIGVISGWVCDAERVQVQIGDGPPLDAAYGTPRLDTEAVCGDTGNGFGLLFNWNRIGDGWNSLRLLVDGELMTWSDFRVTTLGSQFVSGLEASYVLEDFPVPGRQAEIRWQESLQNFVVARAILAPGEICETHSECPTGSYCADEDGCGGVGVCTERPQVCPLVYSPVCGCDGHIYGNRCEAAAAGVNTAHPGACP